MKRRRLQLSVLVAVLGLLAVVGAAVAGGGSGFREKLTGYEEVPALSTPGIGEFRAAIHRGADEISYKLSYRDLESGVQQAHIHFGQEAVNGGVSVFLCSNLGNGPAGTQACPPAPATITGTIGPGNVGGGAAAQGIAAGEFGELVRAMRAGATYVNVHSTTRPGGEIRAQLDDEHGDGRD